MTRNELTLKQNLDADRRDETFLNLFQFSQFVSIFLNFKVSVNHYVLTPLNSTEI